MGFFSTLGDIFQILKNVFRQIFKRPFTYFYPFEDRDYPERTRGRHIHVRENCTACKQCVRACPVVAISIDTADQKYEKDAALYFDYTRCIFCGLCVQACRFEALYHTKVVDISEGEREDLLYGPDKITTLDREPLEWRGRRFR
ncbi:MAG: 4Fe-4S dicluster domain-containing protein [Candidatus Lokiarchaeota archaeon]|nr:4Fe-4S dicluster domain-containing protein [Candidatus Lokiarchaeota archaeon]